MPVEKELLQKITKAPSNARTAVLRVLLNLESHGAAGSLRRQAQRVRRSQWAFPGAMGPTLHAARGYYGTQKAHDGDVAAITT